MRQVFQSLRAFLGFGKSTFANLVFAFVAILIFQTNAQAQQARPWVDPALHPYFYVESNEPVVVIALFHDSFYVPYLENSARTYYDMRYALAENARNSQQAVYNMLAQSAESLPIRAASLWVSNSMVMEVPASYLPTLAERPEIAAIIADHPVHLIYPWDDGPMTPAFGHFGMENEDVTYGLEKMRIPDVRRELPGLNGEGVRVAIIDTGIDAQHPDLANRTVLFRDFTRKNSQTPYDDNGHGTHVAGTVAGGNASGTSIGVAPGAQLIVAKFLDGRGGGTLAGAMQAMDWVADPDGDPNTEDEPMIVSNSWGADINTSNEDPVKYALCKSVDGWVKLGILPVFAIGNSGKRAVSVPGACPSSLSVGATDEKDMIADFSSRGPANWKTGAIIKPEVSAPGVRVMSAYPGGGYRNFSGTSMATPHAAGLAALLYQASPGVDVGSAFNMLIQGTLDLGGPGQDNDYGWGRMDGYKTLKPAIDYYGGY